MSRSIGATSEKIDGLEFARFLLSAAVVFYHYFYFGPLTGRVTGASVLSPAFVFGRFAVEAFFVISGLVIVYSARGRSPLQFAIARIVRLWPAMAICATVTFLALTLFPAPPASPDIKSYVVSALLVPLARGGPLLDPSYWSIAIELKFYFAIFLLMCIAGRLKYLVPLSTAWLSLSFIAISFDDPAAETLGLLTLSPYSAFFIFGILLYAIRYENAGRVARALMIPALALGGLQMNANFAEVDALDGEMSPWWTGFAITLSTFLGIMAFCFRITSSTWSAIAAKLGAVSYPLYLLHQSLGFWMINSITDLLGPAYVFGATLFTMGVVLALAFTLSELIEPRLRPGTKRCLEKASVGIGRRLPTPIFARLSTAVKQGTLEGDQTYRHVPQPSGVAAIPER
jgi:peptidoglycan/LPS O-acetylase OafA/YrhL